MISLHNEGKNAGRAPCIGARVSETRSDSEDGPGREQGGAVVAGSAGASEGRPRVCGGRRWSHEKPEDWRRAGRLKRARSLSGEIATNERVLMFGWRRAVVMTVQRCREGSGVVLCTSSVMLARQME